MSVDDPTRDSWRERLSHQLAILTVLLTGLIYMPLVLATSTATVRTVLAGAGVVIVLGLLAMVSRRVSDTARSVAVVATFVLVGTVGYVTVGFLSGPGVGFAMAVAFSGLLLGRRAMYWTVAASVLAALAVGMAMVGDVIAVPKPADISPSSGVVWFRSVTITFVLITILASAVLRVVESIEGAQRQAEVESRRRHELELQVVHGQSMQLVAQLAASLAHDVNNQLTVISSWSDAATEAAAEAERQQANEVIHDAIAQAAALARRMLMLASNDVPEPKDLSLEAFFDKNQAMLRQLAPGDVKLHIDVAEDAWCHVDETQLGQIVINLVVNACDAMPHGGDLSITALLDPEIHDQVVLAVRDTGTGMSDDVQARAFDPFFTTKDVGKGTGLGLSTVAAIVEQAGGDIRLESTPGSGTVVTLGLPAVPPGRDDPAVPPRPEPSLAGLRILVVDDTDPVLDVARRALREAGALATTAKDGDEAMTAVRRERFDVLCADVVMPGVAVRDLIDEFTDLNPDGVVLLCSGYVGETLLRHGIREGRYHLLRKPYSTEQLVAAVADQLNRVRLASADRADGGGVSGPRD